MIFERSLIKFGYRS